MKFCMLASSSSGNCTVIHSKKTTVLVDAGISTRRTARGLTGLGLGPQVDAVFISHEHSDHCKDIGILAQRFACPIYGTEATLENISEYLKGDETLISVKKGKAIAFQDLEVTPFAVPHDASDPCGYTFFDGQHRAGVCTDLGAFTEEVQTHLSRCDAVSFEANHDVEMLVNGRYPPHLKARIQSAIGHLSNDEAGQSLALMALQDRLKHVILAHLSEHNNHPSLALKTVQKNLRAYETKLNVHLSHKTGPSQMIEL